MAKVEKELPNPESLFIEAQPRFTFGVKAAAYGCGISVRQLDWWTRVGYVPVLQSGRHRRYSANAVKIALLIRSGIELGLSLRRSSELARQNFPYLWDQSEALPEEKPSSPVDELASVRQEVTRLTTELAEIGKRLEFLVDPNQEKETVALEVADFDDE